MTDSERITAIEARLERLEKVFHLVMDDIEKHEDRLETLEERVKGLGEWQIATLKRENTALGWLLDQVGVIETLRQVLERGQGGEGASDPPPEPGLN